MDADGLTSVPAAAKPAIPSWRAERLDQVFALATAWLRSKAFSDLIATLGGPAVSRIPHDLPKLIQWTAGTLDTRAGGERHEAAPHTIGHDTTQALVAAALPLGLLASAPPARRMYDLGVILGGTTTGNRMRVALASALTAEGIEFGRLAALGANRTLTAREVIAEPDSAPDRDEWSNLLRQLSEAFGPLVEQSRDTGGGTEHRAWVDLLVHGRKQRDLRLLVAPSTRPTRRADTADGFEFLIQRIGAQHRTHALVITSAIYVPYQFLVAAPRLLTRGTRSVEVVGTPTATDAEPGRLAQRLAQEIHSTAVATARLWQANTGSHRSRHSRPDF